MKTGEALAIALGLGAVAYAVSKSSEGKGGGAGGGLIPIPVEIPKEIPQLMPNLQIKLPEFKVDFPGIKYPAFNLDFPEIKIDVRGADQLSDIRNAVDSAMNSLTKEIQDIKNRLADMPKLQRNLKSLNVETRKPIPKPSPHKQVDRVFDALSLVAKTQPFPVNIGLSAGISGTRAVTKGYVTYKEVQKKVSKAMETFEAITKPLNALRGLIGW